MKHPQPTPVTIPLKTHLATVERFNLIKQEVAKAHGVTIAEIDGPTRTATVARARQHAMTLAREFLTEPRTVSFETVSTVFNRTDHGTAFHAVKVITSLKKKDGIFNAQDSALRDLINLKLTSTK